MPLSTRRRDTGNDGADDRQGDEARREPQERSHEARLRHSKVNFSEAEQQEG